MNEELQAAANKLRQQISDKVSAIKSDPQMSEVIQLLSALNALEPLLQEPKTTLSALFALNGEAPSASVSSAKILRDEFVHVPALEAAKKYLAKVNRPARSLDEIIKAIKTGGGEVPNVSALRMGLIRSTADVKKVDDDVFGLLEWYPKKRGRPVGSGGGSTDEQDAVEEAIQQYEDNESEGGEG